MNSLLGLHVDRMIGLHKSNGGARPVHIGDIFRRTLRKTCLEITRPEAACAAGVDQLCCGLEAGIEAGMHSMKHLCDSNADSNDWGILLLDARSAFNEGNRKMMVWIVRHLWPSGSRFVFNLHRHHSLIIMHGDSSKRSHILFCEEGVSQGCPASMVLYGLLLLPFINKLKELFPDLFSPWFADDGSAGGKLDSLHRFFDKACELGRPYGYFPEMEKCVLITHPSSETTAEVLNAKFNYSFAISQGSRFIGSFIGTPNLTKEWVENKISGWAEEIENLAEIAHLAPQSLFTCLQRCLQHQWLFLQCVLPNIQDSFDDIESTITTFLSAIFGSEITSTTRDWTSAPIRDGGVAIPKPKDASNLNFITSQCQCTHLIQSLTTKTPFDLIFHEQTITAVRAEHQIRKQTITNSISRRIEYENSTTPHFTRHIKHLQEKEQANGFQLCLAYVQEQFSHPLNFVMNCA